MESEKLYAKYNEGRHWENHPTVYAESFVKFLEENNFSGTVVDVGCGDGRDVNVFSGSGLDALGVDNSKKEVAKAGQKFPNLKFEVQNAEQLSLADNSVGAAFMINVMHYLKKEQAIREILRVLKPGGYFFVHFNIEIRDKDGNVDYRHDQGEIMDSISEFEVVHSRLFERIDSQPVEHKHEIIELILKETG